MLTGFLLGLSLILPIGAQNIFILTQARNLPLAKALIPALVAALNDAMLIFLGYLGASQLMARFPQLKTILLALGVIILSVLGYKSLRVKMTESDFMAQSNDMAIPALIGKTLAVSLLNPHVFLDTVGIIGGNIAALSPDQRLPFVLGCILASFTWFISLTLFSALLLAKLSAQRAIWIDRVSGIILITFAILLGRELYENLMME